MYFRFIILCPVLICLMRVESANKNQQTTDLEDSARLFETLNYLLESNQRHEIALQNQEKINAHLNAQIKNLTSAEVNAATAVSFSAYPSQTIEYNIGTTMIFDSDMTNVGEFYNPDVGIFICPYNGLYLFHVTISTFCDDLAAGGIIKDNQMLAQAISHNNGDWDQGSISVMVECAAFESVWVECIHDNSKLRGDQYSMFAGVLITQY